MAEVKALGLRAAGPSGMPLARWSCPELAREAATRGMVASVSASTVRRWLADDAIKPWQHRSWIFPRDPDFASKAARVLDLYARICDGEPLGDRRVRDQRGREARRPGPHAASIPALPPGRGRADAGRSEYARGGTLAYLAAYDVHRAQRHRPVRAHHRHRPVHRTGRPSHDQPSPTPQPGGCSGSSTTAPPTATGPPPHRLSDAYPNAHMIHLPVHASWLNQVEIYFSVIQRKAAHPRRLRRPRHPRQRIIAFEKRYNPTARPFDWSFTRTDLNHLLTRLGNHDPRTPLPLPHNPRRTNGRTQIAGQRVELLDRARDVFVRHHPL